MKNITIRTSDGKKETISVATVLSELSTSKFEEIINSWTPEVSPEAAVKLFSILTGRPYDDYISSTDGKLERNILESTKFIYEGALLELDNLSMPNHLLGVEVPIKLGELTLGQNLHMRQKISTLKDLRGGISYAVAVYLQPLLDGGSFNDKRIAYWEEHVKELPIITTYQVGFFLLSRLVYSGVLPTLCLLQTWFIIKKELRSAKYFLKRHIANYLNLSME